MNQGEKILLILKKKRINYSQLAEISGLSAKTVFRAVNNQGINVNSLERMAQALGVDASELQSDNDSINQSESNLKDLVETQKKYIAMLEAQLKKK